MVSSSIYLNTRVQGQQRGGGSVWRLKRKPRYAKELRFILKVWTTTEGGILSEDEEGLVTVRFAFQKKQPIPGLWRDDWNQEKLEAPIRRGCCMVTAKMWGVTSIA